MSTRQSAMIEVLANTELEYGDFSQILDQLRGQGIQRGVRRRQLRPHRPALERRGASVSRFDVGRAAGNANEAVLLVGWHGRTPSKLVSNHFWPRNVATLAVISLLLTLASMRLVVPAGMRWRGR